MSVSISWYVCVCNAYQVQQLRQVGVSAVHAVRTGHCRDVSMGKYRFGGSMHKTLLNFVVRCCIRYNNDTVFMSPETVQLKAWRDVFSCTLVKERLICVVIDEAHCIAEWCVGKFLRIQVF
jgi:superfamily II DNA helicase RecQ